MKIGMTLPTMIAGLDRNTILTWIRRIEEGPFSTIAAGERITFQNQDLLTTMAAAAALTERVRLAMTVVVLPLHSTGLMAKQIATLDVLSAGRVTLGVGVGGRDEDFRAAGAPFEKRASRMREQVRQMRRIWSGEPLEANMSPIGPAPVQVGGPEILAGSLQHDSIRRAAAWANGICGFSFGPDLAEIAASFEVARSAWSEKGRPDRPRLVTSFWYALDDGGQERLEAYARRYLGIFGEELAAAMASVCRANSASRLRDILRELRDLGTDELLLVPTTADPDEVARVADLIGSGI